MNGRTAKHWKAWQKRGFLNTNHICLHQVCGPSTWRWPSCCRRASVSRRGAWSMASRAPWTTWWTCSISSWWSRPRSRSTLASWWSFPSCSSPPGTPCTSCTRTRPRENAASTHKGAGGRTRAPPPRTHTHVCTHIRCLSAVVLSLHGVVHHLQQKNTKNKNSGEMEWETRSPSCYN